MSRPQTFRLTLPLLLGILFLLSLSIRMIGISWGLPTTERLFPVHPDEPVVMAASRNMNVLGGKLDPKFYNYGSLYLAVCSVANPAEIDNLAQSNSKLLFGRTVSAICGAVLSVLVFMILFSRTHLVGAIGGYLAATLAPGLLVHSRFMTVDVMASAWITAALYFAIRAYEDPAKRFRFAVLCGVMAGLAAGTKYNGILAVISLAMLFKFPGGWKAVASGWVTSVLVFLATTPGIFINTEAFLRDFQYELLHTSTGHGLVFAGTSPGAVYHLANLFAAFGGVLTVIGLIALVMMVMGKGPLVAEKQLWIVPALLFAIAYFVLIARAEVKFLRYVFPLIPVLALGFGWLIGQAHAHENKRWRILTAVGGFALAGLGGGGLIDSLRYTMYMTSTDVRDQAGEFLLSKGQSVGLATDPWFYSPTLYPLVNAPRWIPQWAREQAQSEAKVPVYRKIPGSEPTSDFDIRLITQMKPEYIALSSFEIDDLIRLSRMSTVPEDYRGQVENFKAFMTALQKDYALRETLGADGPTIHDLMYIRPSVTIWQRLKN